MITSIGIQQSLIRKNDYSKNSQNYSNRSQSIHFGSTVKPVVIEDRVQELLAQCPALAQAITGSKTREEVIVNTQAALNNVHEIISVLKMKLFVIENAGEAKLAELDKLV